MAKFSDTLVLFTKQDKNGNQVVYAPLGNGFLDLRSINEQDTEVLFGLAAMTKEGKLDWQDTKKAGTKSLNLGFINADLVQTGFQTVTYPDGTVGNEPKFTLVNPKRGVDSFTKKFLG